MILNQLSKTIIIFIVVLFSTTSCISFKKVDARKDPISGPERAKRNVEEGRGVSINKARKALGGGATAYEFSTANPMWRASLEIIDFVPLTTVDYSGGIIITDWYSSSSDKNDSIKITIRFLSNEISATNIKILVHQKICDKNNNCSTSLIKSKVQEELQKTILARAALLQEKK